MAICSEIARRVEIPPVLPKLAQLTRLEGSILLKEVTSSAEYIMVEGDLLWRGYFDCGSGEECLWEGAEYFSEAVPVGVLRGGDTYLLEPVVTEVQAEETSPDSCSLVFQICWRADEEVETEAHTKDTEIPVVEVAVPVEAVRTEGGVEAEELHTAGFEEELTEIEQQWREKWEKLQAAAQPAAERKEVAVSPKEETRKPAVMQEETAKELSPEATQPAGGNEQPPYRLKYYRVQPGEDLDLIAERLSASVLKIREMNTLPPDDDGLGVRVDAGQLLRLP